MKTRDSGMPDEAWWNSVFDPPAVLHSLGLDQIQGPVIDVGCGYGTFTLAVARCTQHPVIALDIEPDLVAAVGRRARLAGLHQVDPLLLDVTQEPWGVEEASADIVLLFNILHCEAPLALLGAAYRTLLVGGRVGVIHWRHDIPTPRGPDLAIRPTPDQCRAWMLQTGFCIAQEATILPPYHVGLVGTTTPGNSAS